ncbi:MAG: hypothetical protein JJU05_04330 [Verrucomicrobia bacterium]|nr:hypothetical protein [Verrucomicrobiota bacterium]MCH8525559.1 hypothetical protein [Kiritimatiellia bacterium]
MSGISGTSPFLLPIRQSLDAALVGGKAVNLAKMLNAGFPVPDGFVLTTSAYRHASARKEGGLPPELVGEISAVYERMGSPVVAVRSSATAEDRDDASMAGQYETILNVSGKEALLDAVARCWASLDSPRTRSYLAQLGLRPDQVDMGVVVQEQVAAEVAGVLFTANPRGAVRAGNRARDEMLLEASWGLGESVVSGTVQPDTLVLEASTGKILSSVIGEKATQMAALGGTGDISDDMRGRSCLDSRRVHQLWQLGRSVECHYRIPQDLEWAFADGKLYLLQSRAVTTLGPVEDREHCLTQTREQLGKAMEEGRGPWIQHNLGETLPAPTPLTWELVRRFMSGAGGFGNLYRAVGFEPSPKACEAGFLDLVAGRVYMDLSRAPEMFFEGFPFAYDPELLRGNPGAAQEPPTVPSGSSMDILRVGKRLAKVGKKLDELSENFDKTYQKEILPSFENWIREEKARDLKNLSSAEWLALWREREAKVLDAFAPQSLLSGFVVTHLLQQLHAFIAQNFWNEDPDEITPLLASGGHPDLTAQSTRLLHEVGRGQADLETWLERFGHRAPAEFDLATPRWRERPEEVRKMAARLAEGPDPSERQQEQATAARACLEKLAGELDAEKTGELEVLVSKVHRYLPYREDGKYALMLGYDLLRDLVLEARRRLGVGDELCLLSLEELVEALESGFVPLGVLEERQRLRAAQAAVSIPSLVDGDALATLGEPPEVSGGSEFTGLAVGNGVCEGPVRIVHSPETAGDLGQGYVLVCPSTDPNWTPLFVGASGLILECGGSLSHGAVVAREMGLPAVVIPQATKIFEEGETLRVDGRRGRVLRGDASESADSEAETYPEIPREYRPPVPGPKEAWGARLRNRFLLIWAVFFAAYYALPAAWVELPVTRAMDELLLPWVARLGAPAAVAGIAFFYAAICMAGQRLLTDVPRLREASRRVKVFRKRLKGVPASHPHQAVMAGWTKEVTQRNLQASFVPIAVLLGPMILTFFWFPERVEPGWRNAPPGSTVFVSVEVDGEHLTPVEVRVPDGWEVDGGTLRENPRVRPVLERQYRNWNQRPDLSQYHSWEAQAAALRAREEMLSDLRRYLDGKIPPQTLAWVVRPPSDAVGRFPIRVVTEDDSELGSVMVLGTRAAPEPREITDPSRPPMQVVAGAGDQPLRELRISYAQTHERDGLVFWKPVERFVRPPLLSGWLLVYLLAYVPGMYLMRFILRVP